MKRNKSLIILIISLFLFMATSYAWLNITIKGAKINVLKAGNLSLILDETSSDGINLTDTVPISDEKGMLQDGYTFKLVNNGTVSANYIITLDDLPIESSEERMEDDVLKYSLEKNGEIGKAIFLTSIKENNKRVVDSGIIEAKTTNTYTLKMWLDYDTKNEAMNKVFSAKLNIRAEQENIKVEENEIVIDINDTTKTLGLEEDISNYEIESSDEEIATINSLGNIIGKHYGKVVFKTINKKTGAKKDITVNITKTLNAIFIKQTGVETISKEKETCILREKEETSCSISLPEFTTIDGYTKVGWNIDNKSHIGTNTKLDISEDTNIYTIVKKKEITYTASFNKQSAGIVSIGTENISCTIEEVYNAEEQATSCKITLPEIIVKEGYTSIGWNEDNTAKTGIMPNTEVELTNDKDFYTIIMKNAITLSATFNRNGAISLDENTSDEIIKSCTIEETYNNEEQKTSCSIITPTIEASDATPTICGYATTSKGTTTCEAKPKEEMVLKKSGLRYYAQTYKQGVTYTITWRANGATIGSTTSSCSLEATYNGVEQALGCNITSPSITRTGYTIYGWNTKENAIDSLWNVGEEKLVSESNTYYAITKDTTAPTCGSWSGESTTWTNGTRTISVGCSDGGSGCIQSTYSKTFNSSTKTSSVSFTISDNDGNTNVCTKTANIYIDKVAPDVPTFYRGYQLFTSPNATVDYYNISTSWAGSAIQISSIADDPQIVMKPAFNIKNAIGYIQDINPDNQKLLYQVFYNPTGVAASEANSVKGWIQASNTYKFEYLAFGKTMSFTANSSLVRVDIGTASGTSYYLSRGYIVAEKNQTEVRASNYLMLSTGSTDTGGSGFSYLECKYDTNDYVKLTTKDSQGIYYLFEPSTDATTAVNGKVTYCRAVDNAGNKSATTSITISTTK